MQDFEKTEWKASDMCIYMHNYVHVIHIYTILLSLFIGSSYWPFWNEPTPLNRLSIKTGFCSPAMTAAAAAKSLQSCPTLCDPIDGSPPGSPIPGILQARTLEWVAISFSNAWKWEMKVRSESEVTQSCPTLSDPMDCSPPRSCIHGILQARVLKWGAIAFSPAMTSILLIIQC